MKIRLIGIRNSLGIGVHYTKFADALLKLSHWKNLVEEVYFNNQEAMLAAAARSEPDDINICFVSIPLQHHFRGTNIQWVVFESTRVPPHIMSTMLTADVVWVPSVWGKGVLMENGLNGIHCDVVPEGVDSGQWHPWNPPYDAGIFRYLLTGKYEQRKSITETIDAWAQAFGNDPTAELSIKTNHFENHELKKQQIVEHINRLNLKNVNVWYGAVPEHELATLYHRSNVFVLPTKGEGWGLPLIEAAASGLPIITTMWSGHTEFLNCMADSVVQVDFDMVPIDCPEYTFYYPTDDNNWGEWAQPKLDCIVAGLIGAREDYQRLHANALVNSDIIRKEFSWEQSVNTAMKMLQQRGLLK
jgi:glycosyltransferase involved in cell wall biosynthesis